jgi:hypothetical protein
VFHNCALCFFGFQNQLRFSAKLNWEKTVMFRTSVIASFILAASGIGAPAYAANAVPPLTNTGHLDGVWLKARIKTSVPSSLNWTNPKAGEIVKNVKIDTGKDTCYIALAWGGLDTFSYLMLPVCKRNNNGTEVWELSEFLENAVLFELSDGKSVGIDFAKLYLAQKDKPFHGFPTGYAYTGYQGTIILTPKFNSNGAIKTVTAKANSGTLYSYDSNTKIGGSSRSGFTLKFVNEVNVPAGAKCAVGIPVPGICP